MNRALARAMAGLRRAGVACAVVGALGWLGACLDEPGAPLPRTASVTITPPAAILWIQQAAQLSATIRDANGSLITGKLVVWTSVDPAIATVDQNGVVTGVEVGLATVIASSDSLSDTAAITVAEVPHGLLVSDPVPGAGLAGGAAALVLGAGAGDSVAYVSLTPGTFPTGSRAIVRRVGETGSLTTAVVNGGFDPVPIRAHDGDQIEIVILDAGGGTLRSLEMSVTRARPPIVVRTDPPPRKTDVPVNARFVVIFTEPVAGTSLTPSSIRLLSSTTPVAGTASLLQGSAAAAVFIPSAPLNPNADYRLVVTNAVRDLAGNPLVGGADAEFTTGTGYVGAPDQIAVLPDTTTVLVGWQVQFTAVPRDSFGTLIVGGSITWSSANPSVASVSSTGVVTALAPGQAHIQAQVDAGRTAEALVIVSTTLVPVDSVAVTPDAATIPIGALGGAMRLAATLRDASGNVLSFRQVGWATSDPAVATVIGGSGGRALVTGGSPGTATITATSEGQSDSAVVTIATSGPLSAISAGEGHSWGGSHTCAVTTDAWLLCWGANELGQLGNGLPGPAHMPVGVGGLNLSQVSTAGSYSCALTPGGAAYCWGGSGEKLGVGSTTGPDECTASYRCSLTPLAVQGGLQFATIGVGGEHACGLTTTGAAYCWGYGGEGLLGTGVLANSAVPVAVAGGFTFTDLATGGTIGYHGEHSCALIASGAAYCWGYNRFGQLGDSTTADRSVPVPVAGGLSFVSLSVGNGHTCGLTAGGTAYCWGMNSSGQLGIGTTTGPQSCWSPESCSIAPVPVQGGLQWTAISTGSGFTCGITTQGTAYCWGDNYLGRLGNGTTASSSLPVAVAGGLSFASLSTGSWHSCGVTVAGIAYCWGSNDSGQLGDGTTTESNVPVKVAGQP